MRYEKQIEQVYSDWGYSPRNNQVEIDCINQPTTF